MSDETEPGKREITPKDLAVRSTLALVLLSTAAAKFGASSVAFRHDSPPYWEVPISLILLLLGSAFTRAAVELSARYLRQEIQKLKE